MEELSSAFAFSNPARVLDIGPRQSVFSCADKHLTLDQPYTEVSLYSQDLKSSTCQTEFSID